MKAVIITTDGFEDSEFSYPFYRLQEAGYEVDVAAPEADKITGKHGYVFEADFALDEFEPQWWVDEYDLMVIPGGNAPETLRTEAPVAADIVRAFDDADLPIASICHGPQLLISADILEGRELTGYWSLEVDIENAGASYLDETVVWDDNLITSRVPDDLPAFMSTVFECMEDRQKQPAPA